MDDLIKNLEKKYQLVLLHKPTSSSSDIDFVSRINPKEFIISLVEYLSVDFELVFLIKEDISDSIQIQFKSISNQKFIWIDILHDPMGIGFFSTQSNEFISNKVIKEKFKDFKKIFKYKFQIKSYFKYKKFFKKKIVIINLISNKLYRLLVIINLLLNKQGIFYLGQIIEVNEISISQKYIENVNFIFNTTILHFLVWKYYFRYKGFLYIKIHPQSNKNLKEELYNIALIRLHKYVGLT